MPPIKPTSKRLVGRAKGALKRAVADKNLPDPLYEMTGDPTGNIEIDDRAEAESLYSILKSTQEEAKNAMRNGYWLTLVFHSEKQRNQFLENSGWRKRYGDKDDTYYDGVALAADMGVSLMPVKLSLKGQRTDKRLVEEVGTLAKPKPR